MKQLNDSEILINYIIDFGRKLRYLGENITTSEIIDAINSLNLFKNIDLNLLYNILKITLVKRADAYNLFKSLFYGYFSNSDLANSFQVNIEGELPSKKNTKEKLYELMTKEKEEVKVNSLSLYRFSYSPDEISARRNIEVKNYSETKYIKRSLKTLTRIYPTIKGRRDHISRKGEIDFRKIFRKNITYGGDVIKIIKKKKKLTKARMLILCDVSGSMDEYSEKIFNLLYTICNNFSKSETFIFSTRLIRVTDLLKGKSLEIAKRNISKRINIWGSGTRIGLCLAELILNYSNLFSNKTLLIIVSDGWDLGGIDILKKSLEDLKKHVRRIIWINPLCDNPNYEPKTIGMITALPYIDVLLPISYLLNEKKLRKFLSKYY